MRILIRSVLLGSQSKVLCNDPNLENLWGIFNHLDSRRSGGEKGRGAILALFFVLTQRTNF